MGLGPKDRAGTLRVAMGSRPQLPVGKSFVSLNGLCEQKLATAPSIWLTLWSAFQL